MVKQLRILIFFFTASLFVSCDRSCVNEVILSPMGGNYDKAYICKIAGFEEDRAKIIDENGVTMSNFITYSTAKTWELKPTECEALGKVRLAINRPTEKTLLQKVISLDEVSTYMNNRYGGTVGGSVCNAADVKYLNTLYDIFWGLRLDYEGTKHKVDGGGYAAIRFYSEAASTLTIPLCEAMGGTYKSEWPNGGGGFTTSTLGYGGYPEYVFPEYSEPMEGAELYEVTPGGLEILRARFHAEKKWVTEEIGVTPPKSSKSAISGSIVSTTKGVKSLITTYALYKSNRYIIRGEENGSYHLTTMTRYDNEKLEVIEKGIYGVTVKKEAVEKIWEEKVTL